MGQIHDAIDSRTREFIEAQHVFFVGTAPLEVDGHLNISPKGHGDTFTVLDERTVAYVDLTGSGAESIAHLRQNGRIVVMFCAFEGPPNIVRLHGHGIVHTPDDATWAGLLAHFPARRGARAIVTVDVSRVSDSCGFAVPLYERVGDRELLTSWTERKNDDDLAAYRATKNARSIDGLPALP